MLQMKKNQILLLILCLCSTVFACDGKGKEVPTLQVEKKKLTVMTYNIHHGAPEGSEVVNLENIANTLKAKSPDLIALQEVDVNVPRSGKVNQAQKLAELLGMEYFFSKSIDYQGGEYGVAVLSKFPISNKRRIELPMPTSGEKRSVALVSVNLGEGVSLEFGSTHLDLNVPNRTAQAIHLNALGMEANKPMMIAADYNAEVSTSELQEMQKVFSFSCKNGCPNSFPVRNPTKAIDLVASNKKASDIFGLMSAVALTGSYASDHLPVMVVYNY